MKKGFILALLAACVIFRGGYAADIAGEAIENNIVFLADKSYARTAQKFSTVDLRAYANRDFTDEIEGDGKGGWSDQGANDMREFPYRGTTEFLNIPFDIISPESNNGAAVLAVQGQKDAGVKNRYEIAVGRTAAGLYFLHSSPWASGSYIGRYTLRYTDGTSAYLNIFDSVHISDCYGKSSSDAFRPIWTGKNEVLNQLSLYLFAMSNPHPDKEIESLVVETDGNGPYIMIVAITLTDSGPYLPMSEKMSALNPKTDDWATGGNRNTAGTPLDMSRFLDAPAGKHGGLISEGDGFVFEDGTRAVFWGTNVTGRACFPTSEQADITAERIAVCGFNLVRFSGLSENAELISDSDKQKLAYFVSVLAKRGVYCYLAGDRTDKVEMFFDKELIEKQKSFFEDILTYKNPHTGNMLGEDFCMLELVDGASMYDYGSGKTAFNANFGKKELTELFNRFVKEKYHTTDNLKAAWDGKYDLNSWEGIEGGNLELRGCWEYTVYSGAKKLDIMRFYNAIQQSYYDQMVDCIRSLGVSAPITCNSNSDKKLYCGDAYMNSKTGFTTRGMLWQRPAARSEMLGADGWYDGTSSNVRDKAAGIFGALSAARVENTPYIISKWGTSFLNRYSCELPVMMSAIAAQQGWTPICYAFLNDGFAQDGIMEDHYGICNNTAYLNILPAATMLYYSMPQATQTVINEINEDEIPLAQEEYALSASSLLSGKSGIRPSGKTKYNRDLARDKSIIQNEGIYWDRDDGIFFAETDRVEAVTGFFTEEEVLGHFSVNTENEFASFALSCLDNADFDNSGRLLLTAVGRARNNGMEIDGNSEIANIGDGSVLAEVISARITLRIKGDFEVYALGTDGIRREAVNAGKNDKGYTVLDINSSDASLNYEIIKK